MRARGRSDDGEFGDAYGIPLTGCVRFWTPVSSSTVWRFIASVAGRNSASTARARMTVESKAEEPDVTGHVRITGPEHPMRETCHLP